MLNRDSIIGAKDFGVEKFSVPEWGGEVCLKKWSADERNTYTKKSIEMDEEGGHVNWDTIFDNQIVAVALSLCDESGARLFSDSEEDLKLLASKNGEVLQRLFEKVLLMNGLAEKSTEEAAKNSGSTPKSDSISD
jgi:hypothetical protein